MATRERQRKYTPAASAGLFGSSAAHSCTQGQPQRYQASVSPQANLQVLVIHEYTLTDCLVSRNILINGDHGSEQAILCDFEFSSSDSGASMSTVVGGSPGYIAPERFEGKMNFTNGDERNAFYRGCDMYS